MKKRVVLFSVFCGLLAVSGCHYKAKKAQAYRDNILQQVQRTVDASLPFSDAMFAHEKDGAVKAIATFSNVVDSSISVIGAQPDFDGDTMLRASSLFLLNFYKRELLNTFTPVVGSVASEFSLEQSATIDSVTEKLMMDENHYWQLFDAAEKNFYKRFKLSELEQK